MADDEPEVEYISDEGFVRLNLRRPVNLYVPSEQQESYDPAEKKDGPSESLKLDWVHGYRGRDCRNNFHPLASGELVYFAASVAIVYDPATNTQRHYLSHTDDIKCLAVHPDGKTVATGQIKGRGDDLPRVAIWDSETLETLKEFGSDTFSRGVNCVAFAKDGDLLAAVDDAPEPRLSVWQWPDESKTAEAKAAADPVIGVTFSSEVPSRIVTSGKNHLAFWSLSDEGDLSKKSAIFGSHEKPKYVTSVACVASGDVLTGDSNGNILVWKQGGNTVRSSVSEAHEGSIFCLDVDVEGNIMSSGKDGRVVVYSSELEPLEQSVQVPEENGSPRVVVKVGEDLFIGTTNNCILKSNFEGEHQVLTQGHTEELWGLACHSSEPKFVTAGQDGMLYYRDSESRQVLWSKNLEVACQSVDISFCGHVIVVGAAAGKWFAIDSESQEVMHEGEDGEEIIQVTRFSPDSSKLALGSRDNKVYIYNFEEDGESFSAAGECEGHSSFITHLDWSKDGKMLRTNSGDYEALFWKVEDCSLVTQSEDFKDVEWATNNCILSFTSIGIWPPGTDGTHINGCNKAKDKPLMASGDDFGMVKLFAWPSSVQNAEHKSYHGHSSHVTNVAFLHDDSGIVSSGGRDSTAMQWKVVEAEE